MPHSRSNNLRFLFGADLHGNEEQYRRLFDEALHTRTQALILGGDLAPKEPSRRNVACQREFFQGVLFPLIRDLVAKASVRWGTCRVFVIMGNDDFGSNERLLKAAQEVVGFELLHNRRAPLTEGLDIIGYPFVPFTPFRFKDWEKPDLNAEDERETRGDIRLHGVHSVGDQLVPCKIDVKNRTNTIEKDLSHLFSPIRNRRRAVLVTHAPPHGTNLDMISEGRHIGSRAIRKLIESGAPILSLHGHVHETVEVSGCFRDTLGETESFAVGNSHVPKSVYVLRGNFAAPEETARDLLN